MEYVYAALVLHESDQEVTEENVTSILEAAGIDVDESRVKSLVAALEDVDVEEALSQSAAVPAGGAGGGAAAAGGEPDSDEGGDEAEEEEAAEEEAEDEDEDEDEDAGEGLGELFG